MQKLIYTAIASLDGYVADSDGNFDWAAPSEDVHRFVNDLERPIGTYLCGRRLYETMVYWETADKIRDRLSVEYEYAAIWQAAAKVVYTRTLSAASSANTRLERDFDLEAVRQLKASADRDLSIGGPNLAAHALRAGLVDEFRLFVNPVAVGGGNPALPRGFRVYLDLIDEHRFANGVVFLDYRLR